jgi:flagellar FliL protein
MAKDADTAEATEQETKGGGKLPLVVMAVGLLAGGGAGAFVVGPRLAGQAPAEAAEETGHAEAGAFHSHLVEGLIVNPAGTGGTRLLLISVAIVVDSEDAVGELEERDPELRDTMLSVLGSKTIEEITDPGARERLKGELLTALQALHIGGAVLQVHIPQFVVQ